MNSHIRIILVVIIGMFLIPAILADDNKVPRDGTVYVGEADLDLTNCGVRTGDELAWYSSGNPQGTPQARALVTDAVRFTVDPDDFKGHTGTWYELKGKKSVFKVEEPFLQINLVENGIDRESSAIKRGNLVSFTISTNLAGISKRPGSSGALITLNLTGPNGTEFHSLSTPTGDQFNLDSVYVGTTPYDTGAVWDTANKKKFPDGEYTISASTKVNRIDEIYSGSGITYTDKQYYTLGDKEVKPTPTVTEKPSTKSKTKKGDLSAEEETGTPTVTPTETSSKSSKKVKSSEEPTDEPTVTPTETSSKSSKKVKSSEEPTDEPTVTPTETSSKSSKKVKSTEEPTEEPTVTPTEEITLVPTTIEETPTPTDEPTQKITPSPTRKPLPHPPKELPQPSATPTKASPGNPSIMILALICGSLAVMNRRR